MCARGKHDGIRRDFVVELLGNHARLVGWISDDGRPLIERVASGVLEMANVTAGGLERWEPPGLAEPTEAAVWTPVRLAEVMIIIPPPFVHARGLPVGSPRKVVARVGRFIVEASAWLPDAALPALAYLAGRQQFLWMIDARIRQVDHRTFDVCRLAAVVNAAHVSSLVDAGEAE